MTQRFCCPKCGHKELQVTTEVNTETTGSNYSGGKGCLGFLLFGPFGLLCGTCGQGKRTTTTNKTFWICPQCGKKFRNPDELRQKIQSMNSPLLKVMCIIGAIIGSLMVMMLMSADTTIAVMLGLFIFGLFALIGLLAQKANEASRSKLEAELHEIESNMRRFRDA